jgi:hypothetical protein
LTNENLLSVETHREYSITTGKSETRIFVKMYVDAVKSGLIADLGAERWQTLCVLASFMNERGECYPTQEHIASALKVTRETANRRIKTLCEYRWNDRPIVVKETKREEGTNRWMNARYTILPLSQLAIFKGESESM